MKVHKCRKVRGELRLSEATLKEACDSLSAGGLIVYPTETVYGLGADPFQPRAVKRLFQVKRRPRSMPISMAVSSRDALWFYGELDEHAREFCAKHLPGPVTVLLRASTAAPTSMVSGNGLLGLRISGHPVAAQLVKAFGPITATSANCHGKSPPATCGEAVDQLGDAVSVYIDAGTCEHGRESTVVDLSRGKTKVIRRGALPLERL